MEIRGKAWTADNLEPFSAITYVNPVAATDPIVAIDSVYGRLAERLTKDRTVQRSLITYSMGPGEFDLIVKGVKEKALKEGRKEAWDLARRIAAFGEDTYSWSELDSAFGSHCDNTIFEMPVDEALAKDKKYQEEALRVGDEVEFSVGSIVSKKYRGYITDFVSQNSVRVLTKELGTIRVEPKDCKKTGKHSDEIEKVMASFEKGEKDDDI